ncbi:phosphatase PAP2 family protein [Candidatus Woesearchaeota archaeon]|nr:phosphatase PAP2 family protein [Candidatus Woesearchaeota archaeon]
MGERLISSGLRSPGLLGRKPIIGLLMFIFGSLVFAIIAYNVVNQGPLIKYDLPIAESLHTLALKSSPLVIDIMLAGYPIGLYGVAIIAIILGLYFLCKKFWLELVMVSIPLAFGGLMFRFISKIFMRPRPFHLFDNQTWPTSPDIPGFPSGHALSIIVSMGFLTYLLLPKIKSSLGKVLVVLFTSLMVIYIGFARLYVGDHYLSDIIAGYAVGIAWSGLAYTSIELLFQMHYLRKEKLNHGKRSHK